MHLPFQEREELPHGRGPLLHALVDAVARGFSHCYVHADGTGGERFLFIHEGRVWCAGARDTPWSSPSALSVRDFFVAADSFDRVVLCKTDLALFLCAAVLFRKPPAAHLPAALVDGESLLKNLRALGKDAVLAVQNKDGDCTLAFCRSGAAVALYSSSSSPRPAVDDRSPEDQLLELVYASPGGLTLDVYDDIRLPPAAGAGQPLAALADDDPAAARKGRERPALVVRLGERVVFRQQLEKHETLIGRGHDCDLALDNLSISRRHALARADGACVVVDDLGSENGLLFRGEPVRRAVLQPGDLVTVGKYTLTCVVGSREGHATHARHATPHSPHSPHSPQSTHGASEDIDTIAIVRSGAFLERIDVHERERDLRDAGRRAGRMKASARSPRIKIESAVFTIGSAPEAHASVSGLFVRSVHAVIQLHGADGYRVECVGAWRALRLNGAVVRKGASAVLVDGDHISLGGVTFLFRASPSVSPPASRSRRESGGTQRDRHGPARRPFAPLTTSSAGHARG